MLASATTLSGPNYGESRESQAVARLKQMQFSVALWHPDVGQRVRKERTGEGNRGYGENRPWPLDFISRIFFDFRALSS